MAGHVRKGSILLPVGIIYMGLVKVPARRITGMGPDSIE